MFLRRVSQCLKSGTTPSKNEHGIGNIKKYLQHVRLSSNPPDNLLIVPDCHPFQPASQRIVVPKTMIHGLLTALHLKLGHPSKDQLRKAFNRGFFALNIDKACDETFKSCHQCMSLIKVPSTFIEQSTSEAPEFIGSRFSTDIIKREGQKILTVRENITSYTDALIIPSETSKDIQEGLVKIISKMKSPSSPSVIVKADHATSFQTLVGSKLLNELGIIIELGEPKNPNKNPICDRAISEIQEEFAKIQPEGGPITELGLAISVARLNSKIRNNSLSAIEMWTARSMNTGKTIKIDDDKIIATKTQEPSICQAW